MPELHLHAEPEDFPEHLRSYIHEVEETRFKVFKHPFYTHLIPIAARAPIQEVIAHREELAKDALRKGNTARHLAIHARPFRAGRRVAMVSEGYFARHPHEYWPAAAFVWQDCEQPEDDPCWRMIIEADIPDRSGMMTDKEKQALRQLPPLVTLYRDLQADTAQLAREAAVTGFSWTLDPGTAHFVAKRYNHHPHDAFIAATTIQKDLIIAYLDGRNEAECIVDSSLLDCASIEIKRA